MKKILLLIFVASIFSSCNKVELSNVQKIANAHGFEQWNKVKEFHFTFGGKNEDPNSGRSWVWNPKTDEVTLTKNGVVYRYNRNEMDSIATTNDRVFINDKFWALIPFQLIWDTSATISETTTATSPVKGESLNKLTITYSNKGGYTPGDAYDIFYDNDFIIREWVYRKRNQPEPSLANTFENYQNFNGLLIAQEHKKRKSDWNLLIRNIKVELE